ncbi:MAG TPA: FAD-binding oxidoreductase [Nocardioidaceae bacterium]|nr:FAD-binding oxidoreductase [Nocardioidaceae bacterium]
MTSDESDLPAPAFTPYRWGDPAHPATLPDSAAQALSALGIDAPPPPPVPAADIMLPEPRLPSAAREELTAILGTDHVRADHDARLAHTRGWSTPDLLRLRSGDASAAPDLVLTPADHDQVVAALACCARHRVAVVPYSGGTSVVGGLSLDDAGRYAGVVALDVRRLDALEELDEVSRTATLQSGVRGPDAERMLAAHGYTLGHFPQSYEGASIGGYAATRSAGQASAGYGRFDEMVVALVLATPAGTVRLGRAPMSAAGPDLRQLVLGSEGALGVVTSVTVRVRPRPQLRRYLGWRFESFGAGVGALRRLAQEGPMPTVLRLSDETETSLNLADPKGRLGQGPGRGGGGRHRGCLAIVGFEGTEAWVTSREAEASALLDAAGGTFLGEEPGEAWRTGRYRAPYLRDPLLDAGALVETLETATFWSRLEAVKQAVTDALTEALTGQGTPPVVLCHVSHVYEAGASLYFTVVCAQSGTPLDQWQAAKSAANHAILASGSTISHHHGVGRDHRRAYAEEAGPLMLDALCAVKSVLDPNGVMNPGVLIAYRRVTP